MLEAGPDFRHTNPKKPEHHIIDMNSDQPHGNRFGLTRSGQVVFWAMIALPCFVEMGLQATDTGLLGLSRWRSLAYQNGAFWVGLLGNWRPNYTIQPVTMFVSYALLHAGLVHLIGNMLVLGLLGHRLVRGLGPSRFLLLYVGSAIGGGAGFALLASTPLPMVGASGALFGLAGALLCLEAAKRARLGLSRGPVIAKIIGLIMLNLLFWFVEDGLLAWQTHLGGFITGWGLMTLFGCLEKMTVPPDA